jgi:probable F420-dependent oxidoreductase
MDFSFNLPTSGAAREPSAMLEIAAWAESSGFRGIWVNDHLVVPDRIHSRYPYTRSGTYTAAPGTPVYEPVTMLGVLAGATRRLRLGTGVMLAALRNPIANAKALATLDVLSGGRLDVGVGAGWLAEEFAVFDVPFEQRAALLDEHIRIYKDLWTAPAPRHQGKAFRYGDFQFWPKPVQQPHPPILIGGTSRGAIRRAAHLADGWLPINRSRVDLAVDLELLRTECARAGRSPEQVRVVFGVAYKLAGGNDEAARESDFPFTVGNPEELAADLRSYAALGVDEVRISLFAGTPSGLLDQGRRLVAEVLPRV